MPLSQSARLWVDQSTRTTLKHTKSLIVYCDNKKIEQDSLMIFIASPRRGKWELWNGQSQEDSIPVRQSESINHSFSMGSEFDGWKRRRYTSSRASENCKGLFMYIKYAFNWGAELWELDSLSLVHLCDLPFEGSHLRVKGIQRCDSNGECR